MVKYIFSDQRFRSAFWTQFLGALNDNFFKNALVMLLTYQSVKAFGMEASALVAAAGGIFIFPFFLFSATAGQIADRYEKSVVLRITKWTELLIMIAASAGFFFNQYEFLFVVLFLMGTQSAFFGPIKYGIIPLLVEEEELVSANAATTLGTFIAILIGTLIGSNITSFDNYVYYLGPGICLVAGIGIISASFIKKTNSRNDSIKIDYTFVRPTFDILKMTMKNKQIFRIILGVSWFWFFGAAILSLLPSLVKDVFGGNEQVGSVFLALFTIGMGIGSFIVEKVSTRKVEIGIVPVAALLMSLFLIDIFWVAISFEKSGVALLTPGEFFTNPSAIRAAFDLLLMTVCGGCYIVPQMTRIQEISNIKELSRTIAGNNIWNALFMVSSAVVIIALSPIGLVKTILVIGALNLIVSFLLYAIYSEATLRFLSWVLTHVFYKVKIEGAENIPSEGPVVIASNHSSFVDWLIISAVAGRPVRYVIDHNYYNVAMGPFWFSQAGLIPIAPKNENEILKEKAFQKISESLDAGSCIGIFPEGFITRSGELLKFQPGIKKIVERDKVSVIPIAINGLWGSIFSFEGGKVLFKWPRRLRGEIHVKVLSPISSENFNLKSLEQIIHNNVNYEKAIKEKLNEKSNYC